VLLGKKDVGERVLIIGGGSVGCETGVYLAQQGKKVTIIEALENVISDVGFIVAMALRELLDDANVEIETSCNIQEIIDEGLIMIDRQGKKRTLEPDTIILAVGLKPNRELVEALQGKVRELYVVGDCVESRRIIDAIWGGFRTARLT
jgi:2-enoate reductase